MLIILKKIGFIAIVQFFFDDIRLKSLILVLYMGVICYFEIKNKPFNHQILNMVNYYSSLTILSSICSKLFAFSLMKNFWNSFSDAWIVIMNFFFCVYAVIVLIKKKKKDIYNAVSSRKIIYFYLYDFLGIKDKIRKKRENLSKMLFNFKSKRTNK